MTDQLELGPVDYLVVEFPGNKMTGEGMPLLVDLVEPEWPEGHLREWGQWSPLRGRLFPGTAIFVTRLAA